MTTDTLLYIILAGIAALLLALFQYLYKSQRSRLHLIFSFLRFLTYFFILVLLINPKFEQTSFYNEKPNLIVAVDNSESVNHLDQADNVLKFISDLKADQALNTNFNIDYYAFGNDVGPLDTLSFEDSQSDINKVFGSLNQVYKNTVAPMILITDGNQTFGTDYEYGSRRLGQPIFPLVLGDTITYSDLKIEQLNVNKYAYLKNRFPVEVFMTYSGHTEVSSKLVIYSGNSQVYSKDLNFSRGSNSQSISLTLPANRVGVTAYTARILPLPSEKNTVNNSKPFAVEVIDQKTNVAIVSAISHPDLGVLKKSISSNEQRSVSILKPATFLRTIDNYQLAILYQPDNTFKAAIEALKNANQNMFVITGSQTQWSFLNTVQDNYQQEITSQEEDFQADLNNNYNTFIIDDLDFSSFPPLRSEFGELTFNIPYQTILFKSINGNTIPEPLLLTFEDNSRREALLVGEHLWKWRAQSYLNSKAFEPFDNFFGKLIQYLASDTKRRRLSVNYESFYNGNSNIIITAQYFNKNYEFDNKASLDIILKNQNTAASITVPFVIKQNNYQVDLGGLSPGEYNFTVRAKNGEASQSGALTILDYNVEQQFLNANVNKLSAIANYSGGRHYFSADMTSLIDQLNNDSQFQTIQKSTKKVVPLIDFKFLLALIVLSLALEWFIRKYNGLI